MGKRNQAADLVIIKPAKETAVRVGYTISAEAARLVRVASSVESCDQGDIIDTLVMANLTGYFAGKRGRKGENGTAEPDPAGGDG